jgi:peptidoglycan/LPS O-acetylase OafA/YrhL
MPSGQGTAGVGVKRTGYASLAMIAFYSTLFVIGIFIAAYRSQIILFLRSRTWLRVVLILYCGYYLWFRAESATLHGYLSQGFISGALIAEFMSTSQVRPILRMPALQYFGRISYSLYLVHMIWVGILFRVLDGINPLIVCATVIAASIASADLMNRLIEKPFSKFGRYAASTIRLPQFFLTGAPKAAARSMSPAAFNSPFLGRMHPDVRHGLPLFRQPDHVHRRCVTPLLQRSALGKTEAEAEQCAKISPS